MMLATKLIEAAGNSTQPVYIEDVFSTWLYTGNGSTQTITNGIDLAGKGGLVWIKGRSGATDHALYDTARGATKDLVSNSTAAETTQSTGLTSFASTGFSLGSLAKLNTNAATYASWTFRKQPKFFDVVTYTGTGANRTIAHNLGSAPRCMIVKRTDTTGNWCVYHSDLGATQTMFLDTPSSAATGTTYWNSTNPTSTVFSVGTNAAVNASGGTYVAYLFASDEGGFGLTGTDNVISCGSFTTDASGSATVTLGYEPQWVLLKRSNGVGNWRMLDNMRGWANSSSADLILEPSQSSAEYGGSNFGNPTATGFQVANFSPPSTYIYIAIRRGPMKVPTSGTSVFSPNAPSSPASGTKITTNFPIDLQINAGRSFADNRYFADRLRGVSTTTTTTNQTRSIVSTSTDAEVSSSYTMYFDNVGYQISADRSGANYIYWNFRRAPGFFDEVCYPGTGPQQSPYHNLGVVPELIIIKDRASGTNWAVYHKDLGPTKAIYLNQTGTPVTSSAFFGDTAPTATQFTVNFSGTTNGTSMVAYLFASCPGVSKVGSYTGNGSSQTINCGFTAGARFVLIKRTDSTGDWYVWDSARGIVSGNDPYLLLNSTEAEVTTTDYIDPYSAGFEISSTAPAAINASGGSFIYLAIA